MKVLSGMHDEEFCHAACKFFRQKVDMCLQSALAEVRGDGRETIIIVENSQPFHISQAKNMAIMGFEQKDVEGRSMRIFHGPGTDVQAISHAFVRSRRGEKSSVSTTLYTKLGMAVHGNMQIIPIVPEGGQEEITHNLIALSHSKTLLSDEMLSKNPDVPAVVIKKQEGRVVIDDCNEAFREAFGWTDFSLEGRTVSLLTGPESRKKLLLSLVDCAMTGIDDDGCVMALYTSDGRALVCSLEGFAVIDSKEHRLLKIEISVMEGPMLLSAAHAALDLCERLEDGSKMIVMDYMEEVKRGKQQKIEDVRIRGGKLEASRTCTISLIPVLDELTFKLCFVTLENIKEVELLRSCSEDSKAVGCCQADCAEAERSDLSSSMQLMFYNAPEVWKTHSSLMLWVLRSENLVRSWLWETDILTVVVNPQRLIEKWRSETAGQLLSCDTSSRHLWMLKMIYVAEKVKEEEEKR
ncbi:hypothetical protein GUITHDRAFT_122706 [Guillardia theta CCMP2712]|uniref:PAS domain-containing protein n=1 Tax=Guillardia theta (strain CCMP2712) TaxID=905079 RepID=L1I5F4_GUITC|nr:hypothetical protein GUITHDRAFT_122706 [Guillardia theta CCMP2712]EKX31090.1 hypothetical protein GUITHDRAFT_122706 [Guillardia theta CCMP2712]|eukprot:XP_005818070.1 hypothetical protein GUITHDRAFT_122706 [Guillardia theta CCMP2712]